MAHTAIRDSGITVGLTKAKLQINSNQETSARYPTTFKSGRRSHHLYTLELLKRVYLTLQDWQNLRGLLPNLRKYKVESLETLDTLEKNIYINLLVEAHCKGKQFLLETWNSFLRRLHQDLELINSYTHCLVKYDEADKAISLIENILKNNGMQRWLLRMV